MIWHQRKYLLSLFSIFIKPFIEFLDLLGNLIYELSDNGMEIETMTYSPFIDSFIELDPSLI